MPTKTAGKTAPMTLTKFKNAARAAGFRVVPLGDKSFCLETINCKSLEDDRFGIVYEPGAEPQLPFYVTDAGVFSGPRVKETKKQKALRAKIASTEKSTDLAMSKCKGDLGAIAKLLPELHQNVVELNANLLAYYTAT